jgi:hypothetical protein
MQADILVLEWGGGRRAPEDNLEKIRGSGWKVTFLREFHKEKEYMGVYGLNRLPGTDGGMHGRPPKTIRHPAAPSPTG